MDAVWITLLILLAGLGVVQGILVAAQAYEHRRFARSRLRNLPAYQPHGRTILFVPCRGHDLGLKDNLASLFEQDYDDYEIRFLVETPEDPVCRAIQKVATEHPGRVSRIVFTGKASDCGQKVHNLLCGTESLPSDVKYLAFADSDARPHPHWLRALIRRLDGDNIGATTGYRWFVPMRATPANLLVTSVNASLGMLLGSGNPNIVWGGSWAIRRDRFEELRIRDAWKGKLNDDLVVTRVMRRARLRVEYEPACAVASPIDLNTSQMIEFGRRQYLQARYYLPRCWKGGLALTTFSIAAFWLSMAATVLMWPAGGAAAWIAGAVALTLYASWIYRGVHRLWLSWELFPEYAIQLRKTWWLDVFAGPLAAVANWFVYTSTAVGRSLVWRDIHYQLDRQGNVIRVRHIEGRPLQSRPSDASARSDDRADGRSRLDDQTSIGQQGAGHRGQTPDSRLQAPGSGLRAPDSGLRG